MTFLLSLALKGAVVLALGALAAIAARTAPASVRHSIWAATFAVLLAVPVLEAAGPAWTVGVLPSDRPARVLEDAPAPVTVSRPADLEVEPVEAAPVEAYVPTISPAPSTVGTAVWTSEPTAASRWIDAARDVPAAGWLGGLWALGVGVVALVWLRAFGLARRLVLEAETIEDAGWLARVESAARRSGIETPRLLCSDALTIPIAWGFSRPAIVLPPSSETWDAGRLEAVLLHEMAHLRRRDAWTQVVAQAALSLHWPNPLAWIAYRRFMDAREQACDDAVLRVGGEATSYASHLVAVARELSPSRLTLAAVAPMAGRGELETRVVSILDRTRRRDPVGRRTLALTLALAVGIGGPLAVFHPVAAASPMTDLEDAVVLASDLEDGVPGKNALEDALHQAARDALGTLRAQSPDTLDTDAAWTDLEDRVMADVSRALASTPELTASVGVQRIIEDAMADAAPAIQATLDAAAPQIERAVEQALSTAQPRIDLEVERATREAMRRVPRAAGDQHIPLEIHDQDDVRAAHATLEAAADRLGQAHAAMDAAHRRLDIEARGVERARSPAERRSAQAVLEEAQRDRDKRERDFEEAQRDLERVQRIYEHTVEAAAEGRRRGERIGVRNEARNRARNETRNQTRSNAQSRARTQPRPAPRPNLNLRVTGESPIKHLIIPDAPGTLSQRWDSALRIGGVQIDWPAWIVWGVDNADVTGLHSNAGSQSDFEAESFRDAVSDVIPGRLPEVLFMVKVTQRGDVEAIRLRSPDVPVPLKDETVFWLGRNTDAESRALLDRLYGATRDGDLRGELASAYALHTDSDAVTAAMSRMIRTDASPVVRAEAVQWLSRYHCGDECVQLLIEAVDDPSHEVRREALDALIEADTATSRAAVRRFATSHSDPNIRREAAEAQ